MILPSAHHLSEPIYGKLLTAFTAIRILLSDRAGLTEVILPIFQDGPQVLYRQGDNAQEVDSTNKSTLQ